MEIGSLEAAILNAVKRLSSPSARDVVAELRKEREIAYTTVSTTLDRLHKKGLLNRGTVAGRGGQRYVYSLPENTGLQKQIVGKTLERLLDAFGPSVVSTIYDRLNELSEEDAETLRKQIEEKRRASR